MNLLEIRTQFVTRNGRFDLVVDTTDYADNGADFFIQAGQRFLDSVLPNRKSIGRYVKGIVENQSSLILKKVRYIDAVYIKESGEERDGLDRKSYSWIIDEYGDDFGERAKGTGTVSAIPTEDETLVIDTETYTFKDDADANYEVEIGSTVSATITNLVDEINNRSSVATAHKLSSTTFLVEYYLVGTAGNSIAFTTTAGDISLDGSGYLGGTVAGRANGITTGEPTYFAPIVSNPHPDLQPSDLGTDETHDLIFGYDRFKYDGILFGPPADGSYTMTVYGAFYSVLENDLDVSYHSEMYPELLIMAANMAIEVFYRNAQGFKDWMTSMQPFLTGIDHDMVRAEMVLAGNQLRG